MIFHTWNSLYLQRLVQNFWKEPEISNWIKEINPIVVENDFKTLIFAKYEGINQKVILGCFICSEIDCFFQQISV